MFSSIPIFVSWNGQTWRCASIWLFSWNMLWTHWACIQVCTYLFSSCWLGFAGNAVFRRNCVESVTLFCIILSELCRVLCFSTQSQFPSVALLALLVCAGYQCWVEGSFETDYSASVCARCCCICCTGQPLISLSSACRELAQPPILFRVQR